MNNLKYDLIFYEIPVSWPEFPYLQLKNKNTGKFGCLIALNMIQGSRDFNDYIIFLSNILDFHTEEDVMNLLNGPKIEFNSIEELSKAGWEICYD